MKAASALRINYWNRSMLVLRCSTPASQASGPRGSKWGCRRLCTTMHSQETRKTSSKSTSVLVWRHPMNMRRSTVSNNSLSRSSWLDARQYLKLMEGGGGDDRVHSRIVAPVPRDLHQLAFYAQMQAPCWSEGPRRLPRKRMIRSTMRNY